MGGLVAKRNVRSTNPLRNALDPDTSQARTEVAAKHRLEHQRDECYSRMPIRVLVVSRF